jgi:hypothetical protein
LLGGKQYRFLLAFVRWASSPFLVDRASGLRVNRFVNVFEALAILAIIACDVAGAVLLAMLCKPCGVLVEVVGAIIGGFLGMGVGLTAVCLTVKVMAEFWEDLSGIFQKK